MVEWVGNFNFEKSPLRNNYFYLQMVNNFFLTSNYYTLDNTLVQGLTINKTIHFELLIHIYNCTEHQNMVPIKEIWVISEILHYR